MLDRSDFGRQCLDGASVGLYRGTRREVVTCTGGSRAGVVVKGLEGGVSRGGTRGGKRGGDRGRGGGTGGGAGELVGRGESTGLSAVVRAVAVSLSGVTGIWQ